MELGRRHAVSGLSVEKLTLCAEWLPTPCLLAFEASSMALRKAVLHCGLLPEVVLGYLTFAGRCSEIVAALRRRAASADSKCLPHLVAVIFRKMPTLTDEDVESLLQLCPNLKCLDISENQDNLTLRTFDALRLIEPVPPLQALLLPRIQRLTHFRLVSVLRRFPQLQIMDVPLTQPTTSAVLVSEKIDTLHIAGPVTEDLLNALQNGALPKLQDLALLQCPGDVLVKIARTCPLEKLALPLEPNFSCDDTVAVVEACGSRLKHINILGRLTESKIAQSCGDIGFLLASHCPHLQSFVSHAPQLPLSGEGLVKLLDSCPQMRRLHLTHFAAPLKGVPSCCAHPSKDKMEVAAGSITDRSICKEDLADVKTSLSLKACTKLESLSAGPWLNFLERHGPGKLEELFLLRLPAFAPSDEDISRLISFCQGAGSGCSDGLRTLHLGRLPLVSRSMPTRLLYACKESLMELHFSDLQITTETWEAISCLTGLKCLTLRELLPDPCITEEEVESNLLSILYACKGLRRLDLYKMGTAITDRVCLALMSLNLQWRGGKGLRWLRLDLRFGTASPEVLLALTASPECPHVEFRTLPCEPSLLPRREVRLKSLPKLQAIVRAHVVRRRLRQQRLAATMLQAFVRGKQTRKSNFDAYIQCQNIQAWVRGVIARQHEHRRFVAVVRLQATVRGRLERRRLDAWRHSALEQFDSGEVLNLK